MHISTARQSDLRKTLPRCFREPLIKEVSEFRGRVWSTMPPLQSQSACMQTLRWIWSLISGAFSENKLGNTIIEKQVSWIRTPPRFTPRLHSGLGLLPPCPAGEPLVPVRGEPGSQRLFNLACQQSQPLIWARATLPSAWRVCALALCRCGRRQLPRPTSARGQAAPLRARLNAAYLPSRGQRLRRGRASIDVGPRIPPLFPLRV